MVTRFRSHQTKNGSLMGFVTLEDIQGSIDLVVFPKCWEKYSILLGMDRVLIVYGRVDNQNGEPKILVDKLEEVSYLPDENLQNGETDSPYYAYIPPAENGFTRDLDEENADYPTPAASLMGTARETHASSRPNFGPDDWHMLEPPADPSPRQSAAPEQKKMAPTVEEQPEPVEEGLERALVTPPDELPIGEDSGPSRGMDSSPVAGSVPPPEALLPSSMTHYIMPPRAQVG